MADNTQSEVDKIKEEISQLQGILNRQDNESNINVTTQPSQANICHQSDAGASLSLTRQPTLDLGLELELVDVDNPELKEALKDVGDTFCEDDLQSNIEDFCEDEGEHLIEDGEAGSLEVCLQLNQNYQILIKQQLLKVQHALAQNRERQAEIKADYNSVYRKEKVLKKGRSLLSFAESYFKGNLGQGPPLSEEAVRRHAGGEPSPHTLPTAKWQKHHLRSLVDGVRSDGMEQQMQPILNRREMLMRSLNDANKSDEMKEEMKITIQEFDESLERIKNLPDEEHFGDRLRQMDFTKISMNDLEGSRSPFECQVQWRNQQHPSINMHDWTPQEIRRLDNSVKEHGEHDWELVSQEVGGGRLPWQCLEVYQREIPQESDNMKFTEKEDKLLVTLVESFRIGDFIPFQKVGYFMNRLRRQVAVRWNTKLDPKLTLGYWKPQEDELLKKAVKKCGTAWLKVAELVPGRHATSVRERWLNALNPDRKTGSWSIEEDIVLLEMILKYGRGKWKHMIVELALRTGAERQRSMNSLVIRLRLLMIQIEKFKKGIKEEEDEEEEQEEDGKDGLIIDVKEEEETLAKGSSIWMRKYVSHLKEKQLKRKQVMDLVDEEKWDEIPFKFKLRKIFSKKEITQIYSGVNKKKKSANKYVPRSKRKRKYITESSSDDDDEEEEEDYDDDDDDDDDKEEDKVTDAEEEVVDFQSFKRVGRQTGRKKLTLMDTIVATQIQHLLKSYHGSISKDRQNKITKARQTLSTLREIKLKRSNLLMYLALLRVFQVDMDVTASWIRLVTRRILGVRNQITHRVRKLKEGGKPSKANLMTAQGIQSVFSATRPHLTMNPMFHGPQIIGVGVQARPEITIPHVVASPRQITPTQLVTNTQLLPPMMQIAGGLAGVQARPVIPVIHRQILQPQGHSLPQPVYNVQLLSPQRGAASTNLAPPPEGGGVVPLQPQLTSVVGLHNQMGQFCQPQLLTLPLNYNQQFSGLRNIHTAVPGLHQNLVVTSSLSPGPVPGSQQSSLLTTSLSPGLVPGSQQSSLLTTSLSPGLVPGSQQSSLLTTSLSPGPVPGSQQSSLLTTSLSPGPVPGLHQQSSLVTTALLPGPGLIATVPSISGTSATKAPELMQSKIASDSSLLAEEPMTLSAKSQDTRSGALVQTSPVAGTTVTESIISNAKSPAIAAVSDDNSLMITTVPATSSNAPIQTVPQSLDQGACTISSNSNDDIQEELTENVTSQRGKKRPLPQQTSSLQSKVMRPTKSNDAELMCQSVDGNQVTTENILPENDSSKGIDNRLKDVAGGNSGTETLSHQSENASVATSTETHGIHKADTPQASVTATVNKTNSVSNVMSPVLNQVSPAHLPNLSATPLVQSIPRQPVINQTQPQGICIFPTMMQNSLAQGPLNPGILKSSGVINIPGKGYLVPVQNFNSLPQMPSPQNIATVPFTPLRSPTPAANTRHHLGRINYETTTIILPYCDHAHPLPSKILTIPDPQKTFSPKMLLIAEALPEVEQVSDSELLVPTNYFKLFDEDASILEARKRSITTNDNCPTLSSEQTSCDDTAGPEHQTSSGNESCIMVQQIPSATTTTTAPKFLHESIARLIFRSDKYNVKTVSIAVDIDNGTHYLITCIKKINRNTKCSWARINIRPTDNADQVKITRLVGERQRRTKPFRVNIPDLGEYNILEDVSSVIGLATAGSLIKQKQRQQESITLPYSDPNQVNQPRTEQVNTSVNPALAQATIFSAEELTEADKLVCNILGSTGQINQSSSTPTRSIPLLPPNLANVKAFKGLLLHRNKLTTDFTRSYMAREGQARSSTDASANDTQTDDGEYDLIHCIRKAPQYKLFKARFRSLFAWPAMLSRSPTDTLCSSDAKGETTAEEGLTE